MAADISQYCHFDLKPWRVWFGYCRISYYYKLVPIPIPMYLLTTQAISPILALLLGRLPMTVSLPATSNGTLVSSMTWLNNPANLITSTSWHQTPPTRSLIHILLLSLVRIMYSIGLQAQHLRSQFWLSRLFHIVLLISPSQVYLYFQLLILSSLIITRSYQEHRIIHMVRPIFGSHHHTRHLGFLPHRWRNRTRRFQDPTHNRCNHPRYLWVSTPPPLSLLCQNLLISC